MVKLRLLRLLSAFCVCLMALAITYTWGITAGPWHGTWSDSPNEGYQNWHNLNTQVRWVPTFKWDSTRAAELHNNQRQIELEWYDPQTNNHCNRLEPFYLEEYGGDWVDGWWTDNQCNGGAKERLVFTLKETNVAANTWYQVATNATKLYHASYGGETNVSWTCSLCGDDWLGKQIYTASYDDAGSDP